jgi:hypothetical protein
MEGKQKSRIIIIIRKMCLWKDFKIIKVGLSRLGGVVGLAELKPLLHFCLCIKGNDARYFFFVLLS